MSLICSSAKALGEQNLCLLLFTVGPMAPGRHSITVFGMVELSTCEFGCGVCAWWDMIMFPRELRFA